MIRCIAMATTCILVAALSSIVVVGTSRAEMEWHGRATVIDGDTIEVVGQRIRLFGIDAPEFDQTCFMGHIEVACGARAAIFLSTYIQQREIRCVEQTTKQPGSVVATCYLEREDIAARLVSIGHALAYREFSQKYVAVEERARSQNRGIWRRGFFLPPWEWRRKYDRAG